MTLYDVRGMTRVPLGKELDAGEELLQEEQSAFLHDSWLFSSFSNLRLTNARILFEVSSSFRYVGRVNAYELHLADVANVCERSVWSRFRLSSHFLFLRGFGLPVIRLTLKSGKIVKFQVPAAHEWIRAIEARIQ